MERERTIEAVRALRSELSRLIADADSGAVYRALQQADTNLHWCLWQLGHVDDLLPDNAPGAALETIPETVPERVPEA